MRWIWVALGFIFFAFAKEIQPWHLLPPPVTLEIVAEGFQDPLYVTSPPNDERLFVVNRSGSVVIVKENRVLKHPFLDVSQKISTVGEMGLLSLAFHPEYAKSGRVFALFTQVEPFATVIAEFKRDPANPDRTLPGMKVLFSIPQQPESSIHRGGHLEFGPDGKLYGSTGDSGLNLGQDGSWNGKVFRLDVEKSRISPHPDSIPVELYAKGFRNAWRFSFDTKTGEMYLGDVGSSLYEEINLVRKDGNYGWPHMEGYICLSPQYQLLCNADIYEEPIYSYPHLNMDAWGGSAVIGGYIYRGEIESLQGMYIFADMLGNLWGLKKEDQNWQRWSLAQPWGGIVSLGRDFRGELYAVNITNGTLYRLSVKPTDLKLAQLLEVEEKPETIALDGFSELFQNQRWVYGPVSSIRLYFEEEKPLYLYLAGTHSFKHQVLSVIHNGKIVFKQIVPEKFDIALPLDMITGVNELRFEVSQWNQDPVSPYAFLLTDFALQANPEIKFQQ